MHDKTLTELKAGLQAGDFSSRELTEHFLDRIKRHDGELNSFITVTEEQPAHRPADRAQGYFLHRGRAHQLRLADAG